MFAYDVIAINFPWFGNNCHFPPDVSIISEWNYAILQFNRCSTKVVFKAVYLQLFYWSKNSNITIRLQLQLYHFIMNNLLWCLLWKYSPSDKVVNVMIVCFLNPVHAIWELQEILISTSPVDAHNVFKVGGVYSETKKNQALYPSSPPVIVQAQVQPGIADYGYSSSLLYFLIHCMFYLQG